MRAFSLDPQTGEPVRQSSQHWRLLVNFANVRFLPRVDDNLNSISGNQRVSFFRHKSRRSSRFGCLLIRCGHKGLFDSADRACPGANAEDARHHETEESEEADEQTAESKRRWDVRCNFVLVVD